MGRGDKEETWAELDREHERLMREGEEKGYTPAWIDFAIAATFGEWRFLVPPFVAGVVVSMFCNFGATLDPTLFETVAQVAPVIVLGTLAAQFVAMTPLLRWLEARRRDPAGLRLFLAGHLGREGGLFLIVETTALIGVALGYSTTFLVVTMLSALVLMVVSFFVAQHDYFFGAVHSAVSAEPKDEQGKRGKRRRQG